MSDRKCNVVIIGGFGHSVCFFDEIQNISGFEIASLSPAFKDEPLDFITDWPTAPKEINISESYPEALEKYNPDAVIISTHLGKNLPIIIDCLNKGYPVITEKPMSLSLSGLNELEEAVSKTNCPILPMHMNRGFNDIFFLKEQIQSGLIGKPVLINTRKSYQWGTRPDWFFTPEHCPGIWPWIGIHALDMAEYITGESFISGCAVSGNHTHVKEPRASDIATGFLTTASGCLVSCSIDLLRPDGNPMWGDDWCRVVGTKGILELNRNEKTLKLTNSSEKDRVWNLSNHQIPFITDFIKNSKIRNLEDQPKFFHITRVALEMERSTQTKEPFHL